MEFSIQPLGDFAFVVRFPNSSDSIARHTAASLARYLNRRKPLGIVECVAALGTLTIFYDPLALHCHTPFGMRFDNGSYPSVSQSFNDVLRGLLESLLRDHAREFSRGDFVPRIIELPVCYGGEFGVDLEFVARHTRLAPEQVIELHSGVNYVVEMIGFAPGFPYLSGLPPQLSTPRRATPRLAVASGSVGIGGAQTGVYSIDSPGGWQLIGRTPVALFRPQLPQPSLLRVGNRVRFRSISRYEFDHIREAVIA
jgi:inhibitor of KinA